MQIAFTKMHGLGNDFVLIDARDSSLALSAAQLARLADRRYGVGCDQVLMIDRSLMGAAARYRIFNADGSPAEHCGNGVRCVAKYLFDRGEVAGSTVGIEVDGRCFPLAFDSAQEIRVDMGEPRFVPAAIPLAVATEASEYPLAFEGRTLAFGAVSIGNPHAVFEVDDLAHAPVERLGTFLQAHPLFPSRVNVGFVEIINSRHVRLRVFERGVGETPACGTGACAAVAVGIRRGRLAAEVAVDLRGGTLRIAWTGPAAPLYMTGPAATVFVGTIEL